ncbi:MAG TPA: hypothetical protein VKU86_09900 [Acidimicrobiales bacterium]|nr:hypothetical protein [Acidimicrobiales bacterium]
MSLSRFATGLVGPRGTTRSRVTRVVLASLPLVVIVVVVVARVTRHL